MIAGAGGTGKTNFTKALVRDLRCSYTIVDPLDQYGFLTAQRLVTTEVEAFEDLCRYAWEKGNHLIIVEEAEQFLPNGKPLSLYANRCILPGRNRGIGLWANTRRFADLHKTPIAQAQHLFLFRMFLPNDIEYLAKFIPRDIAQSLASIPEYHFLHYSEGKTELCKPVAEIR